MNPYVPRRSARYGQHGQGIIEFAVVIGVFGALLLGIFQVALLYRAKTTVDYAAFMAAREGALHGATQTSVDTGMVKGLAPLFAADASVAGLVKAAALAKAAQLQGLATAAIVSPTQAMFNQVAVQQFDGVKAIPNDDLAYRSAAVRAANVLKVRVTYDYPLIVPVIDRILGGLGAAQQVPVPHADGSVRLMWALPVEAQAIANMQSPIRNASALGDGGTGVPPDPGGNNPPPVDPPPTEPTPPPDGNGGSCTVG